MRPGVDWLYAELPQLVERGVLSPEAADALRRHYGALEPDARRARWGETLLAAFGALLVGGGLILILAHNWDDLGRPARAAIALGTLVAAQALTFYAVARRASSKAWIESASAFLVAAVGAAIALVGQTYHVGGSFEGFMRTWLWLVVLVPYVTGSSLAAIGICGLLVVRVMSLPWRNAPWDPWLLALAVVPFVILRVRREPGSWPTALVAMVAATSIFIVGSHATMEAGWNGLWAVFQVAFLSSLIATASWPPGREAVEPWRGRLLGAAWVVLIVLGTILSFDDVWRPAEIAAREIRNPNVAISGFVAVACAVFSSMVAIRLARAHRTAAAVSSAAALLVVVTHAFALGGMDDLGWVAFNLWLLAVGTLTLIEGVRAVQLGTANRGLLALSALILARFFDTELSFLVRGLGFVTLGIACFALNLWLMRRVRRSAA